MWCVAELQLPYERLDAGFIYGVVDQPSYLELNPNGTVPTLQDGDNLPLWKTGAILRYLAGKYGPGNFWPGEQCARAHVNMWAEWSKLNIAMKFTAPIFWRVVRTPPSQREPVAIRKALAELDRYLDIAESRLSGSRYLIGNHFTLADLQFGHCLFRYYDIEIARTERRHLRSYYDALTELMTR